MYAIVAVMWTVSKLLVFQENLSACIIEINAAMGKFPVQLFLDAGQDLDLWNMMVFFTTNVLQNDDFVFPLVLTYFLMLLGTVEKAR